MFCSWQPQWAAQGTTLFFDGVHYVVTTPHGILFSSDAKSWEASDTDAFADSDSARFLGLVFGHGFFLGGETDASGQRLLASTDGAHWQVCDRDFQHPLIEGDGLSREVAGEAGSVRVEIFPGPRGMSFSKGGVSWTSPNRCKVGWVRWEKTASWF